MSDASEMTQQQLLKKYSVPAPRYTSYPTVPYWDNTPSAGQWIDHLCASVEGANGHAGAAIYLHIPFCESLCTFCGCNTRITRNHDAARPYIEKLHKEWQLYRSALGLSKASSLQLAELHLGGGTPTFLTPDELKILVEPILAGTQRGQEGGSSIEIDPRVTSKEHLQALRALGFDTLSMGIQDFDPRVQQIVNRVQEFDLVKRVTEWARDLGFASISYDLIYGLPLQTADSIRSTLARVFELAPDRIAFYGYAHVPWIKPRHRQFTDKDLPSMLAKRSLYELGRELLEEQGFGEIGMDHFAKHSDPLWQAATDGTLHRNFVGYAARKVEPLIGLGVSAISDSWSAFMQNEKVLEKYYIRLEEDELPILRGHVLNQEDLVLRRHILNLMTQFGTSWRLPGERTGFMDGLEQRLAPLARDGLIDLSESRISILLAGRPFIRNIAMAFDARLARRAPDLALFTEGGS